MKMTLEELRSVVRTAVKKVMEDAKKSAGEQFSTATWASPLAKEASKPKKGKKKEPESRKSVQPKGFTKSEAHDMSQPLSQTTADGSVYQRQGAANFGPYTESVLRSAIRPVIERVAQARMSRRRK